MMTPFPPELVLLFVCAHCVAVNDPMRFVIAGLGWWGRSWTDVLKIHPKAQIVATVDPSAEARVWSQDNLAVAHFPDLDAAFDEVDADAVLVTTPPRLHATASIKAIEHGKHVLVEKPMATSPQDVAKIADVLQKSDVKVM